MLEAVVFVAVLGGAFGAVLAVAGRKLAVEVDPRIDAIAALLPGANCGSCGYPGCGGLAEAIVNEGCKATSCMACSPEAQREIAGIMGCEEIVSPGQRKVARLACNGCKQNAPTRFEYTGIKDCHVVAKFFGGPGKCKFGCRGFGSCVTACPFHAIQMGEHGLPVFDYDKCVGCGICVKQCPQMVLYLSNAEAKVHIQCSNREKGKAAMGDCQVSCISCGLCVRNCPVQAITMQEDVNGSLPVIDYDKCIECGVCVGKCPRHCIHLIDPISNQIPQAKLDAKPTGCAACAARESCGMHA